jgi:sodium-dependent dicarboxylate transporter 2/3/5
MGGMMLGLGLERSGLHRRIALRMLVMVGASPRRLVAAFMGVTALLSMWLSNSATTMMLAPIGLSVIQGMREEGREDTAFAAALMLGIAYAASIGGMGTPMGTPTNLVMTGFVKTHYGIDIGMLEWMRMAVPVLLLLLPLAWVWLCFGAMRVSAVELPGGRQLLRARLAALGPRRNQAKAHAFQGPFTIHERQSVRVVAGADVVHDLRDSFFIFTLLFAPLDA